MTSALADLSTASSLNGLGETDPSNQNRFSNACYIILTEKRLKCTRIKISSTKRKAGIQTAGRIPSSSSLIGW
jgi:hypothetical protein